MKIIKKIGFFIGAAVFLSVIFGCGDFIWRDVDVKNMTISNLSELKAFRDRVNSGYNFAGWYIELLSDIDLSDEEWIPIGRGTLEGFRGTFNGRGNVINGVNGDGSVMGFFDLLDESGIIRNLGLTNVYLMGLFVGGLVSFNFGTIENCYVIGTVIGTGTDHLSSSTGGFVGTNSGIIRNSYADVDIFVFSIIGGGFVGVNATTGEIENSHSKERTFLNVDRYVLFYRTNQGILINSDVRKEVEMKQQSTFAGWDFVNTWGIDPDINNGFPHLLRK
ncbi:MAG: hypothetical protein FWE23_11085 [Chitinivibrionia bacterium]|nr:hypothetical protein [Chitinivibrionia bacterium]